MIRYCSTPIILVVLSVPLSLVNVCLCRETTFTNPVAPNGHDPWVIQHKGSYYYCYSHKGRIWVNKHTRLQQAVQFQGNAIWKPPPGKPYSRELWAPELHFIQGRWYVYVAADDGKNENHRMYVLESRTTNALGEYIFKGKIHSPSDKWAIDGTVMTHKGKLFFIWSGWAGDRNLQQNLYIAKMNNPTSISGKRALISKPEYKWEKIGKPLINEGPQVLTHDGRVFIIYSASGSWTDHYCLGQLQLTGNDPLDPGSWKKTRTPVFRGTATVFSPGHASFTKSPNGAEHWIVYHAAKHRGAKWNRNTRMQRFTWDTKGNPVFGKPVSETVAIQEPSE